MSEDSLRTLPGLEHTHVQEPSLADTLGAPAATVRTARPLRPGDHLGRYAILEQIGRGGMSIVYAAYDAELDRRVAIKVMLPQRDEGVMASRARNRLLREAQAMAQLSHPNVIAVHDVGVRDDEQVFLAMEFVAGSDLKAWQHDTHTLAEILDVYLQAGRGLIAAHRAGLVHRDFKPDNVLLGDDGRVRVVDFGLVYSPTDARSPLPEPAPQTQPPALSSADITRTGALVGTPAYMAPEQFTGGRGDERSDQFSYCVALFEALYGTRPFAGNDMASIALAVTTGDLRIPAGGRAVPASVLRALKRGLSTAPADRYRGMAELLADLADDPVQRRRRYLLAGAVGLGFLGLGALAWVRGLDDAPVDPCTAGADRRDEVWSAEREARMRAAFESTGTSLGPDAWERASAIVDTHLDAWQAEYDAACRRTRVAQTQTEELFELQVACLEAALRDVEVVAEVFEQATQEVVFRAVDRAASLGSLQRCRDDEALRLDVRPPSDPAVAAQVEQLRDENSQAYAQWVLGHRERATQLLADIEGRASQIDYPPLRAEVAVARAGMPPLGTTVDETIAAYEAAFDLALATGHDVKALEAAADLVSVHSNHRHKMADGVRWARHAQALHERLDTEDRMRVPLLSAWGTLEGRECKLDTAVPRFEEAIAIGEATGLDQMGTLYNNLGGIYAECGDPKKALPMLQKAYDLDAARRGPTHPSTLTSAGNLAAVRIMSGDVETAATQLEGVLERGRGTDWERMGQHLPVLSNLSRAYRRADRLDDADRVSQEVVTLQARLSGADSFEYATALETRALVLWRRGDRAQADEILREVDTIMQRAQPGTIRSQTVRLSRAELALLRHDVPAAIELVHSALELSAPEDAPGRTRRIHAQLAGLYQVHGDADATQRHLEQAEAIELGDELEHRHSELLRRFTKLRRGDFGPVGGPQAKAVIAELLAEEADEEVIDFVQRSVQRWQRDPAGWTVWDPADD